VKAIRPFGAAHANIVFRPEGSAQRLVRVGLSRYIRVTNFTINLGFLVMSHVTLPAATRRKNSPQQPKRLIFWSCVMVTMLTSAARAGPVFDRLSGSSQRGDLCFVRNYDAEHLEQHPNQRVTRFQLRRDRGGPDNVNNPLRFTVAIGFSTKHRAARFGAHGICTTRGAIAECGGEGDTGRFRVSLLGQSLRIEVIRLELEGSGADLAKTDDRVFLLQPARPEECKNDGQPSG
jgi:hypothetical protein